MSAWCLGVLNSHRKFFLSYTAPVIWNITIIASLLIYGRRVDQATIDEFRDFGGGPGSHLADGGEAV